MNETRGGFKEVPQASPPPPPVFWQRQRRAPLFWQRQGHLTVCGRPGAAAFLLKRVPLALYPPLKIPGSSPGDYTLVSAVGFRVPTQDSHNFKKKMHSWHS